MKHRLPLASPLLGKGQQKVVVAGCLDAILGIQLVHVILGGKEEWG